MDLLWGISLSSHSMGLSHAQPPLFPCKHTNEKRKQKRNEKKRPVGIVVCEKIADPSTSTSTNERREIVNAKKAWRRTTSAILRMEAAKAGVERKAKAAKKATILYPKALLEALTDRIHDKQWQSALQVFGLLREQQWYRPNTDIYIKLLVMLGTCKQPEKACILYQMMLQERCNITVEVYTALLAAYGRNGHLDKAFSVLEEMKAIPHCQPNIYTYTIFIKSCVELGHFEHVDRLLSEMSRAGVRPNNVTYNTIIGGFGKACMFQEMENVLSLMLESQDCKPDVWTMNSTVRAFGNRGQIEKMEKWVGEIEKMEYFYNLMITEGFKPNRITLCSLVSAYSKGGIFNKITKVLRQMENYKIVPDTPFFNSVLDAYQRAGNMTEMEHMFHQMEDRGCQPDKITFAAMISAYRSEGMLKKVQEMENKMRRMQRSTH
ncbi:hypothetical protein SUGI_0317300 [Cryptomeria japonica]|nr:hypothetical protein SUGI_0317300 [Cryptomeria japonica]